MKTIQLIALLSLSILVVSIAFFYQQQQTKQGGPQHANFINTLRSFLLSSPTTSTSKSTTSTVKDDNDHKKGLINTLLEDKVRIESKEEEDIEKQKEKDYLLNEHFLTDTEISSHKDNVDSLIIYKHNWLIATAKGKNALLIFDAKDGSYLFTKYLQSSVNITNQLNLQKNHTLMEITRPNGISIYKIFNKDYIFITERDGHQISIMDIRNDFKVIYQFAKKDLIRPYALDLYTLKKEGNEEKMIVFVTDNYMERDERGKLKKTPPIDKLDKRIKVFELIANKKEDNEGEVVFQSKLLKTIGDVSKREAILHVVETVIIDEAYDRLLIADEEVKNIKIYNFTTHEFNGQLIGDGKDFQFIGEPEGFLIFSCQTKIEESRKVKSGFYIFSEQLVEKTKFHIVRRDNLKYVTSFVGNTISKTDGVGIDEYLDLFYAVHNDSIVGSFKLKEIVNNVILKNMNLSEFRTICPNYNL
ncbi:hypothetical protein ABK040_011487 [Willaertia magna]